jgi:hypothetical protein
MPPVLTNWKTTLAGVAVGATAVAHLATMISTGHIDPASIYTDLMALAGALGLVAAKDANVTGGSVKQ